MSIELVARILNTPTGLHPTAKMVLIGLANHANPDGTRVFPSVARIARYAECDPRTVQRQLKALRLAGWIEVVSEASQHRPNEYRIRGDRLSTLESRGDIQGTPGVTSVSSRGDIAVSPESSLPVIEPSESVTFDDFWTAYPRKVGKGAARKAWSKALKGGADPETILLAATGYNLNPKRSQADIEFTAHPATWLNAERWLDEVDTPGPDTRPLPEQWREAREAR